MHRTLAIARLLPWLVFAIILQAQFVPPAVTTFNPTSIAAGSDHSH